MSGHESDLTQATVTNIKPIERLLFDSSRSRFESGHENDGRRSSSESLVMEMERFKMGSLAPGRQHPNQKNEK